MTEAERVEGPYRVVELSMVTDEAIQDALNTWHVAGYRLDGLHFAMRESNRRPSMAFLVFVPSDVHPGRGTPDPATPAGVPMPESPL